MDLEAHVDPHSSVRSNHFSDNYFVVRSSRTSQRILYYLDAHFHVRNSVLSFVRKCSVFGEGMERSSKKILKCSSHWDLSIELFNNKFRALGGPKLRFCDFFHAQVAFSCVFCTLKMVSGEGCEGKKFHAFLSLRRKNHEPQGWKTHPYELILKIRRLGVVIWVPCYHNPPAVFPRSKLFVFL